MTFIRPRRARYLAIAGLCAAALTLSACAPGSSKSDGETLSIFTASNPQSNPDMKTNDFTKTMAKKFNVKFSFETTGIEAGPAREKRQLALGSGDYPDLFMLVPYVDKFSQAELLKLSKQGVVVPLQDLIKKYAPNVTKAFAENPEFKNMATAPDGKIYGMPQWSDCFHCSYQDKLWMNSAWLKKLGLSQPKTTEDLRKVLTAFKNDDPNGNGKADEIPMTADVRDNLVPYLMNAFIYDPQGTGSTNASTLVLNKGKVDLQANKNGWRDGLKYIHSLYKDGLIDPAAFTQDADALKTQGDNAAAATIGSAAVLHPAIFVTLDDSLPRAKEYDAVPPLTGPDGANFTGYTFPSSAGSTFVLTNKATPQEQITAVKMLNYFFTPEAQLVGGYGKEGVAWKKAAAGDVALDAKAKPVWVNIQPKIGEKRNSGWGGLVSFNNTAAFRNSEVVGSDPYSVAGYERRLFDATKLYEGHEDKAQIYPYWSVWLTEDQGSEVATLQTNIESYISQNNIQFITGSKNIDTDWDAYVKGLKDLGLDKYLKIQQTAYDKSEASSK
ncbi:type 2 periplasmic-binding domain-containing protein [Lacisediminihabitans sp. FW035]